MHMEKKNLLVERAMAAFVVLCVIGFLAFLSIESSFIKVPRALGDETQGAVISGPSLVVASTSVTTAGQLVLATSTGRQYAIISNDSQVPVYLYMLKNAATSSLIAGGGILIASSSSYEITNRNTWYGALFAITKSGSANVLVTASQ